MENIIEETKIMDTPKKKKHKKLIIILSVIVLLLAILVTLFCVFKEQIAKKVLSEEEYLLLCFYQDTQQILEVSDYDYEISELTINICCSEPSNDDSKYYSFYVLFNSIDSEDKAFFNQAFDTIYESDIPTPIYSTLPLTFHTSEMDVCNFWMKNHSMYYFRKNFIPMIEDYPTLATYFAYTDQIVDRLNSFNRKEPVNRISVVKMDSLPLKIKIFA